jgi:hypothetical protein
MNMHVAGDGAHDPVGPLGQHMLHFDNLPRSWIRKCADSTPVAEIGLVYLYLLREYHK